MRRLPVTLFLGISALVGSAHAVDFNRDVRPILSDKCFACHGPDAAERKADLRLDTKVGAFADLGGYAAFVPGKPEASEALKRVLSQDPEEQMPPKKFHKEMTPAEIDILRQWIADGADYQMHWSFRALERPAVPKFEGPSVRNDVDRFILRRLREHGLEPSVEADKVTLARRLNQDLLGLPPTPEQVEKFVKDTRPDAYEQLVDELLGNQHFGERMALYWLDLVRYADTIGYHSDNYQEVSAYRDYVISSFNTNRPFDQFTIEQLAGDLLPNATVEQKVASGYNLLLQTTEEGGAQAKEYMAIYAADRVRNVSGVWMGATLGCAQCHDHKYDPFSARDFYSMAAFFADLKENAVGKRVPNLKLPTAEETAELNGLRAKLAENTLAKVLGRDPALAAKVAESQRQWEAQILAQIQAAGQEWTIVKPANLKSSGRATLTVLPDNSVLSSGRNPDTEDDSCTIAAKGAITGLRLEALTHESLAQGSLSRANGNFVMTNLTVKVGDKAIAIREAKADFEQSGFPVGNLIDADLKTGWAVNGHVEGKNRTAIFLFAEPVTLGEGEALTVEMQHRSEYAKHNIGRFRLSVTTAAAPSLSGGVDLPVDVARAFQSAQRTEAEAKVIAAHFQTLAPELAGARKDLETWTKRVENLENGVRTMLISESMAQPRMTRILPRGNWLDESGEEVQPAVPVFLPHESIQGRRANRLDLAKWIVSDTNPLTARAFTNRLWKLFFGAGISRNLDDLGGQGVPPSHPELLDWMGVELRESGWDVKHMVKLLVTSGTYRQVSTETKEQRAKDPGNTWFSHQNRWRLEAELVRDTALDLGGLLVDDLGGKSVKPYQPAGYWAQLNFPAREWQADQGEGLYRRGIYTFWCRTFLHPAMVAFDAPSREECTAERSRSNTPQQALVLLNDPVFVEASRAFGSRIAQAPGDEAAKLNWAWRAAMTREPKPEELAILQNVYADQKARYTSDPESAGKLLKTGTAPLPSGIEAAELAAWTAVGRTLMNAYETTSRN